MTVLAQGGRYLLYGLLENRESDHDLRFIGCTDDVIAAVGELGDQYEAYMGFDRGAAIHWEPGMTTINGVAAVAALGLGLARGWVHGV